MALVDGVQSLCQSHYLTKHTDLHLDSEGSTYAGWHAQAPGHINAHTFAVTWMENVKFSSMFCVGIAFWNILEPFDESREMVDEWKMHIPPATVWITISEQVVHGLCFKQREEGSQVVHRDGSSPEIWVNDKQKFAELAKSTDIDNRCRGLAREAAKKKERVEQKG